jgi:hypothetical protein
MPVKRPSGSSTSTEHELLKLQTSLGNYIQHEFKLDGNMSLIESCLPHSDNGVINSEDACQIIIKEFWKQLKAVQS